MSKNQDKGILLDVGTNEVEFLKFGLQGQVFGINVSKVRQVMVYNSQQVVEIPGTPAAVKGQICFRGNPIPVIDLSFYLKGKESLDSKRLFLVCEFNLITVAFIVDSVDRILRCSWKSFRPMEQNQFGQNSSSIVGTVMINEDMIPIIDVELVLTELIPSAGLDEEIEFTQEELTPKGVDREKVNLIYCEDSVIVQRVLSKVLKAAGYTNLKMYPNPTEALESLKNENSQKVDLIISDIEMPRMDGLTFCKELRGINRYKNTPFVFFSSTVSEEMKRKCASVGGNRAFSKPEIKQVISSLDELVSLSKSS